MTEWTAAFRASVGGDYVFCLINDGSTDASPAIMRSLAEEHPEIRIIDTRNTGHGAACLLGYRHAVDAGAEWVVQIDSDGQCDPSGFDRFWQARSTGQAHYGLRKGREDGWRRRQASLLLSVLVFLLTCRWVRDPNVPYRLMSREALLPALGKITAGFRLTNVLLSILHAEHPGIAWHRVRFRRRPGRQRPPEIGFFVGEAVTLLRDYASWLLKRGATDPVEAAIRIGRPLVGCCAAYYLMAFLALAFVRAGTAAEFDWMESVHLVQVHRVLAGQPLYPSPSLEFVPLLYPPLYTLVSSALALAIGESYAALRLVSLAAAVGTQVVLWLLARRMGASTIAAWVVVGLYAGMDSVTGFSLAAGRLDSLFVFFTVLTAYCLWRAQEEGGAAVVYGGLAAAAAVLTKQTALAPILALCVWSVAAGGRRGRMAAGACLGAVLLSQAVPMAAGDGWFLYYLYELPAAHPISNSNVQQFFESELSRRLSLGVVLSLWAIGALSREGQGRRTALFCLCFLLGMSAAGLAPRFKVGGSVNNLMPLGAALALCCGLAAGLSIDRRKSTSAWVLLLTIGFNVQLFASPRRAIPWRRAAIDMQLKADLFRKLDGPVFAPCDPYLPLLAGKTGSAFWGAIYDVWLTPGDTGERLREELQTALTQQRFRAVVLRKNFYQQHLFPYQQLEANYQAAGGVDGVPPGWEKRLALEVYTPRERR